MELQRRSLALVTHRPGIAGAMPLQWPEVTTDTLSGTPARMDVFARHVKWLRKYVEQESSSRPLDFDQVVRRHGWALVEELGLLAPEYAKSPTHASLDTAEGFLHRPCRQSACF